MTKLKEKNRKRLIEWMGENMMGWLGDKYYAELIIDEGFKGLNNFTDEELLDEYKLQVRENNALPLSREWLNSV